MSRNGAGVYSLPGTYEATPGETILASQHNDPLEDLQQDANTPRPVVAGGTGSTTEQGAIDAFFATARTIKDDKLLIVDPADDTKCARLDAGNVTAGQTRVLAVPDYDGVIAAESKATAIASASMVDLATATGSLVHITGTTTITALGTVAAGREFMLVFDGALTLTHNGTSLILPGAANITTAAGDTAVMVSEGSGNWRCVSYQRATGGSAAKAWCIASAAGVISASYNITSVTKTSTGRWTVVIDTDLSSTNYVVVGSAVSTNAAIFMCDADSFTAGQFKCSVVNDANVYVDPSFIMFAVFGAPI